MRSFGGSIHPTWLNIKMYVPSIRNLLHGESNSELKGLGVYKVIAIIKLLYINSMEMYQTELNINKTTPNKEHKSSKKNPETN